MYGNGSGAMVGYGSDKAAAYQTAEAAVTGRQTEVAGEMDRLANTISNLIDTADSLCGRLSPIRRQTGSPAGANKEPNAPDPVLCGVADAIRSRRREVERAIAMLAAAASELEI